MAGLGVCAIDDIALSVLATVIGRRPRSGELIVDAGWMALSPDRATAGQGIDQGYGLVCDLDLIPYPELVVREVNQEHGIVASRAGSPAAASIPIGAKVRILPNHACATAAQHAAYAVIDVGGRVADVWPRLSGW
jgi:D-serine deaminase-like pyridoxal phosphate-dependent protein